MHDGYLKVFEKIKFFRNTGSIEGWIRRIIVNNIIDTIRKKNKISFVDNPEESLSSLKQDDEENLEMLNFEQINAARIIELIQELPPAYRTVFNLYVIEDYSHKEISEMLNINIGTSKSNLSKAKVKLKKLFIEKYGNIYEQLG